jgi:hypothetical protein
MSAAGPSKKRSLKDVMQDRLQELKDNMAIAFMFETPKQLDLLYRQEQANHELLAKIHHLVTILLVKQKSSKALTTPAQIRQAIDQTAHQVFNFGQLHALTKNAKLPVGFIKKFTTKFISSLTQDIRGANGQQRIELSKIFNNLTQKLEQGLIIFASLKKNPPLRTYRRKKDIYKLSREQEAMFEQFAKVLLKEVQATVEDPVFPDAKVPASVAFLLDFTNKCTIEKSHAPDRQVGSTCDRANTNPFCEPFFFRQGAKL